NAMRILADAESRRRHRVARRLCAQVARAHVRIRARGRADPLAVEVARILQLDDLVAEEVRAALQARREDRELLLFEIAVGADVRDADAHTEPRQRTTQQVDTDLVLEVAVRSAERNRGV